MYNHITNNQNIQPATPLYHSEDYTQACILEMASRGLQPDSLIADGCIKRFSVDDKKNKRDEWYIAFQEVSGSGLGYLICFYGSWSTGERYTYKSWEANRGLSRSDRQELEEAFKKNQEIAAVKLKQARDEVAAKAYKIWEESLIEAPSEEYLRYTKNKKIEPIGARFGINPYNYPALIIPIMNSEGKIRSLQYISVDDKGESFKTFLSGGEKQGNFYILGTITDGQAVYIAEGYATAVSVFMAKSEPVVIAFDAHNLAPVTENIKALYPKSNIIIAADNDETGLKYARIAAQRFGCKFTFPRFTENKDRDPKDKIYTDFNDLHQLSGLDEVTMQLASISAVQTTQDSLKNLATDLLKKEDPCSDFSLEMLPPKLSTYISEICGTTSAHPIIITSSVLATASAFIGTKAYIPEGEYFSKLYTNVWLLNISESGMFKTTALMKGAKLARDRRQDVLDNIDYFKSQFEYAQSDLEKKALEEAILKENLRDVLFANKTTTEAFLENLGYGRQGVILASELGVWLENLQKAHNNDLKGILTDLYDAPESWENETKTCGKNVIRNAFFSICGVSALPWIKKNIKIDDVASGFFARFLIFAPPGTEEIPPALPLKTTLINPASEHEIKAILENIAPKEYKLSNSARDQFSKAHDHLYTMHRAYGNNCKDLLEPYVKRWSPYILKLAMIFRLFEDPTSAEISDSAVRTAIMFVLCAIKSTTQLFEGELGESEYQRKVRSIYEWICKKVSESGQPVKRKTILTSKKLKGDVREYDAVLQTLTEGGRIKCIESGIKAEWTYEPIKAD